ncbi:unnamed protein product [Gemmataceae bacterium]|nr:unnamed protein product [Gemmataceae bacterium]VTT98952.1 unnamed protein product [Gemmataceae bacterium]
MRFPFALLLAGLLAHAAAAAGPEITPLPPVEAAEWKEVRVAAGELVWFQAQPASTWDFIDDGVKGRAVEDGKVAGLVCGPGRHRVIVTARDGSRSRFVFVAGGPEPGPRPPEPVPVDALAKELRDLLAADPSPTKRADLQALSALYALMVGEADATVDDVGPDGQKRKRPAYETAAALNATFVRARDSMLKGPGDAAPRLPALRKRCGDEVAAVAGTDPDAPVTDATRAKLKAVYGRLARAVADAAK